MVIVIPLPEREEGDPPTVPAGIGLAMWLVAPEMADGIDAEGGVQHKEHPPDAG
jgi:hypothetical protein